LIDNLETKIFLQFSPCGKDLMIELEDFIQIPTNTHERQFCL